MGGVEDIGKLVKMIHRGSAGRGRAKPGREQTGKTEGWRGRGNGRGSGSSCGGGLGAEGLCSSFTYSQST